MKRLSVRATYIHLVQGAMYLANSHNVYVAKDRADLLQFGGCLE